MNKKAINSWNQLKWFYRFLSMILIVIVVYSILYSAFNFQYEKAALGKNFVDKILYSNAFKLEYNSDVLDCNKLNEEYLKNYFYYNTLENEEGNIIKISYKSPVAVRLFFVEENKELFFPSKEDYTFLLNSYLGENSNVEKFEKTYIVKVYCNNKINIETLKTKTYVYKR